MITPRRIALLSSGSRDEIGTALLSHLFASATLMPIQVDCVDLRALPWGETRHVLALADAVLFTGGSRSVALAADRALIEALPIYPRSQLVGSQCSGALFLSALGLLEYRAVATDTATRPLLEARGHHVLPQSFVADEQVASAGGVMAAPYLAAWVLWRFGGARAAEAMLEATAPVGQRGDFAKRHLRSMGAVAPGTVEHRLPDGGLARAIA